MIEYVIWATNPLTGQRKPISDNVFSEKENNYRLQIAKENGWLDLKVQQIDLENNTSIFSTLKNSINL